jgi:hypothetical protein
MVTDVTLNMKVLGNSTTFTHSTTTMYITAICYLTNSLKECPRSTLKNKFIFTIDHRF